MGSSNQDSMVMSEIEKTNQEAFHVVASNFKNYNKNIKSFVDCKIASFKRIPITQQNYISSLFEKRLDRIQEAIDSNQAFLDNVVEVSQNMFGHKFGAKRTDPLPDSYKHTHVVLKQVFREWSTEAADERTKCYGSILKVFQSHYSSKEIGNLKVLVPGSGLGRLVYELSLTGCSCIHNDNDMHMLMLSYGFMNNIFPKESFTIYPWINEWSNNYGGEKLLFEANVPDVEIDGNVKMVALAGDFYQVFDSTYDSSIDCIVTCFFIDTSPNIISLIEKLHLLLKEGGTWINLGPLSYHYADTGSSIEPTFEEIMYVVTECLNFKLLGEITTVECPYFANSSLMHQYYYKCPLFIVRK